MPQYKRNKGSEPQPVLTGRTRSDFSKLTHDDIYAIAGVVMAAISHQNAVYLAPGRFGSLTMKFYIEGEQFAETLNPGDDWRDVCEQVIEALWDQQAVANARNIFPASVAVRAAEGRKVASSSSE